MKMLMIFNKNQTEVNEALAQLSPDIAVKFITTRTAPKEDGGMMAVHYLWYEERTTE